MGFTLFESILLVSMHQTSLVKLREVFEFKTMTYLTQVWYMMIVYAHVHGISALLEYEASTRQSLIKFRFLLRGVRMCWCGGVGFEFETTEGHCLRA